MNTFKDRSYMEMAYSLAERAVGWASPNPNVGAVIVKGETIVGYGYHERPGKPHAEIIALQRAGRLARKGTAYITLEPCTHWGRTPPCIGPVLEAGLERVVISSLDPNPLVNRKGIAMMRQNRLDAAVGLLAEKNDRLNESYFKYITKKIPFVTIKAAVSLDGKMATKSFISQWISSPETRDYSHLIRGEHDAIMVGINTLLKDNPLLTVRHRNWKGKRITRIILDSNLRFPLSSRICDTRAHGDILVFTSSEPSPRKANALAKKGVSVIPLPGSTAQVRLENVLAWLGKSEISSVLVEGGSRLITALLEKRLADKIILALSPKLIGGKRAISLYEGEGASQVKDALLIKKTRSFPIADETIIEGYF